MKARTFDELVAPVRERHAGGDGRGAMLGLLAIMRTIAPRGTRIVLDGVADRARRNADVVATVDADELEAMIESARGAFEAHVRALSDEVLARMERAREGAMPSADSPRVSSGARHG